jgi:hypothetical protein
MGINGYWQMLVNLNDGSRAPIVIYSLAMPDGFPEGMELQENGRFFGFCYKRWAYQASDAPRLAPVILTKNAEWTPQVAAPKTTGPSRSTFVTLAIFALIAGVVISIAVYINASWKSERSGDIGNQRVQQLEQELADKQLPTIQDVLREMESKQKENS